MRNSIHDRSRAWVTGTLSAVLFVLLVIFGISRLASCTSAPKSVEQFEEMDDAAFADWLTRVRLWAHVAASQILTHKPEDAEKVLMYASLIEGLSDSEDPLAQAADVAALDSPLVAILVLEAKALLNARGGLPGGPRTSQLLHAVAEGVRAGAAVVEESVRLRRG